MVPTTNASSPSALASEFTSTRAAALNTLPPVLSPAEYLQELAQNGTSSCSASSTGSSDDISLGGALADSSAAPSAGLGAWSDSQFRTVAIALLGANVALGAVVLVAVLLTCARGAKGRNVRYAPVPFRELQTNPEQETLKYAD